MDFALDDDQRALAVAVKEFLADRFPAEAVREVVDDVDGDGCPPKLWTAIAEQGWLAVLVPTDQEGLGLGLVEAQVVARAFGAATVPGPWAATVLGGEAIRLAGSPAQQAKWLPRVAAGEIRLAVATATAGGDWTAATAPFTSPDPAADTSGLSGLAEAVEYPAVAERIVAATRDGALWLVEPSAPGVHLEPIQSLDGTTRLAQVRLQDAPAERLTGSAPEALSALHRRATVLVAADLVGIARAALTRTVAYDKDRVQFGVPVGSFQALKHALADLHVGVSLAEHGVLYAAYALDAGLPDAAQAVNVAKAKASDVARDATAAMIQYHGGIGYTWEHDAHFYFKRAKREEYLYGDGAWHRELLAARLVD